MDYISSFDIRLDKEIYYAGERLSGNVLLENTENIKIKGIRVLLRGKVHASLKVVKSGERRTIKDDQYVVDEKLLIWGKDKCEESEVVPILARGVHQFPFVFHLPQTTLPCSLECRYGTIRYYIKKKLVVSPMLQVIIDIPYASSPQGVKYFTVIGPHIDCMEEKYLSALSGQDRKTTCCWCCRRGALALRIVLERTAYVCGENIRIRAQVENRQATLQMILIKLIQHVELFIDKGVLGESKTLTSVVFEHKSSAITPNNEGKYDSSIEQSIRLPVVPPTLIGICRLLQIYYILRICLVDEKGSECLHLEFPLTVATVPYRIPNAPPPPVDYDFCVNHVEGGKYVSPEFRLGHVYDGEGDEEVREEEVVLYRPVYVKLAERGNGSSSSGKDFRSGSFTRITDSNYSMITESNGRRRSVVISSPEDLSEPKDERIQSVLNIRLEGNDDDVNTPLIHNNSSARVQSDPVKDADIKECSAE
ncbi:arrestin domain protein [Dictyocaulus viviparus]|uniref:Arrestin domain protein n=1 Tax=Dictyocaulus viviparus TaxID=29172 RepID=A0A0D8XUG4_DICVI|nr:arrestin domain protein [Dictyocaulus viviparus]